MSRRGLWVRWSWRDLRGRWVQVAVIALVIALGTGTYAGLLSTSEWRRQSNDASFAVLHLHDVEVRLNEGSTVAEGTLAAIARGLPHAADVTAVRERLVAPTQVAGPGGVLVPGEIVGSALGPAVDTVSRTAGRALTAADDGAAVVVVERQFAAKNGLPPSGDLTLSGRTAVTYVGQGQSPEHFLVSGRSGALPFLSQRSYGVLFATLHSAQRMAGATGRVNDVVVTTRAGRADVVRAELDRAVAAARPPLSAAVTGRADVDAYRVLYDDIEGDAEMWRIIALLVLAGAAFAAFNLTSRIVEAQRREIGIGMALGVSRRALAVRPLLFGAQVALIGVALGLVVGWLVGLPLRGVFTHMLPLPVWRTPFQPGMFAQAAVLGFLLPFVAVAWPVWRAVRAEPVDAIRIGHLAARGSRFTDRVLHVPLPGRGYRQMPVRNVLRTPRRTLLTTLGVAAAITTLVTMLGLLDSFYATLDSSERDLLRSAPDRVAVSLRTFEPVDGAAVAAVRRLDSVGSVSAGLIVPGTATYRGRSVELVTEVVDAGAPWVPDVVRGVPTGGLVLARKAAADLHVRLGDTVRLEHPQATAAGMRTVTSDVRVVGLHPNPMRVFAYVDPATARVFGLAGMTNLLTVRPASGATSDGVRRALLSVPQVASAQATRTTTEQLREGLDEFVGILRVVASVTLLLALLIAFNTSSIGMDERAREHATMLAFGLPSRTVLGMAVTESGVIGVLATSLGVLGGRYLLGWLAATTVARTLPEVGVIATVASGTLAFAVGVGVATVAFAPVLTGRKLRRLDIPSTLRVVE